MNMATPSTIEGVRRWRPRLAFLWTREVISRLVFVGQTWVDIAFCHFNAGVPQLPTG